METLVLWGEKPLKISAVYSSQVQKHSGVLYEKMVVGVKIINASI